MATCTVHPESPAVAYCRSCGKPLCQTCQRFAQGTVFCEEHVPAPRTSSASTANPYTAPYSDLPPRASDPQISPGLAFVLGLIPGVGAIYNGQYGKGLVHLVVFGMIISIVSSGSAGELTPLFSMLIPGWVLYMAFEAYHTARKRQLGQVVDEFSSLFPLRAQPNKVPIGPVVLIGLGVLFLLNNLDILKFYMIVKYWPLVLIGLGVYMLYTRFAGDEHDSTGSTPVMNSEVPHER